MVECTIEANGVRVSNDLRAWLANLQDQVGDTRVTWRLPYDQALQDAQHELLRLHREEMAYVLNCLAHQRLMARYGLVGRTNGLERAGDQAVAIAAALSAKRRTASWTQTAEGHDVLREASQASVQSLAAASMRLVPSATASVNAACADLLDGKLTTAEATARMLCQEAVTARERAAANRILACVARHRHAWRTALDHSLQAALCLPDAPEGWVGALQAAVRALQPDQAMRCAERLAAHASWVSAHGPHLLPAGIAPGNERLHSDAARQLRQRLMDTQGAWIEEVFRG